MTHYVKVGETTIAITFSCEHPELGEDGCPTRLGNCGECRFCKAELSAKDALTLVNANEARWES